MGLEFKLAPSDQCAEWETQFLRLCLNNLFECYDLDGEGTIIVWADYLRYVTIFPDSESKINSVRVSRHPHYYIGLQVPSVANFVGSTPERVDFIIGNQSYGIEYKPSKLNEGYVKGRKLIPYKKPEFA